MKLLTSNTVEVKNEWSHTSNTPYAFTECTDTFTYFITHNQLHAAESYLTSLQFFG